MSILTLRAAGNKPTMGPCPQLSAHPPGVGYRLIDSDIPTCRSSTHGPDEGLAGLVTATLAADKGGLADAGLRAAAKELY